MKTYRILLATFAVSVSFTTIAGAVPVMTQEQQIQKVQEYMKKADKDGDGKINESEYNAIAQQGFHNADANGDKGVTAQELVQKYGNMVPQQK